jgi:protein N-terminal amidase
MAWMTREDPRRFSRMPNEPDMETLTYWVTRLEPAIRSDNQEEIIVVFCNRTGIEDEATYAGTSAVIGIQDGEVRVYGLLGRGEKELLIVDTNEAPYAKLIYRPDVDESTRRSVSLDKTVRTKDTDNVKVKENSTGQNPTASDTASDSEKKQASETHGESSFPNTNGQQAKTKQRARSRSRSRGQSPGRQSTPPAPKATDLPPLPTLPDDLAKELEESLPKHRQAPSISIPPLPGLTSQDGSAKSPGSEGFDIPTPSAPSPTPQAIRPKLIIPTSLSGKVYQYPSDQPISALSERSEQSVQSIRSDESEASVQTVKSTHGHQRTVLRTLTAVHL